MDGVLATIDALPECVSAARGKIKIHVDGGFRTGTDIFKALALGADCCWVGRPALWGLAVSDFSAVSHTVVVEIFKADAMPCRASTMVKLG